MNTLVVVTSTSGSVGMEMIPWIQRWSAAGAQVIIPNDRPYENALNKAALRAVQEDYDWMLICDADNPPVVGDPLVWTVGDAANVYPVIGFPTPMFVSGKKGLPVVWNVFRGDPAHGYRPWDGATIGIVPVDAVGSGCLLVSVPMLRSFHTGAPFSRKWDQNGIVLLGGDLMFCDRVHLHGHKVFCDFDRPCHHYTTVDLAAFVMQRKSLTEESKDEPTGTDGESRALGGINN